MIAIVGRRIPTDESPDEGKDEPIGVELFEFIDDAVATLPWYPDGFIMFTVGGLNASD